MWQIRLFFLLIVFIPIISVAKNRVVYYEPKFVELTGTIKRLTFPGPPNYESIRRGDANETGPYLILKKSIDVVLYHHITIGNDEPEKNVKILQLVVHNDADWIKIKEGAQVKIKGTLFKALFGHHHSRVLLEIKSIMVLPRQKIVADDLVISEEDYQFMTAGDPELNFKIILNNPHTEA